MMKTLQEFLEEQISEELILAVLSGSRKKEIPSRVRIRPVELKGRILYQASSTVGTKVLHENYTRKELLAYMEQGSLQEIILSCRYRAAARTAVFL